MPEPYKPTKQEIAAAEGKTVPDLIRPDLKVLFCGINPGLYSGAVAHHFARPGNRFWPVLHAAGFTRRILSPFEEAGLLEEGYGITNLVERSTARAGELTRKELEEGGIRFLAKIRKFHPRIAALLGLEAFRKAFGRKEERVGEQSEKIGGTKIWVLPNPSGLNAHYQIGDLVLLFEGLRAAAEEALNRRPGSNG
ncbi:MAG: G/U mismatch-specific DNA glycosylase [Desulfobacteraceae bacterium]|nr:MAG: G/U mismatch-specific DNA glycosylase [Desulfobacteraceae bacterium]